MRHPLLSCFLPLMRPDKSVMTFGQSSTSRADWRARCIARPARNNSGDHQVANGDGSDPDGHEPVDQCVSQPLVSAFEMIMRDVLGHVCRKCHSPSGMTRSRHSCLWTGRSARRRRWHWAPETASALHVPRHALTSVARLRSTCDHDHKSTRDGRATGPFVAVSV